MIRVDIKMDFGPENFQALANTSKILEDHVVTVGTHKDRGLYSLITAVHELGTNRVPSRPFLVPGLKNYLGDGIKDFSTGFVKVIARRSKGKRSRLHALVKTEARQLLTFVHAAFDAVWSPPIQESTWRQRKRSLMGRKPLVDTGVLRNDMLRAKVNQEEL